MKNYPPKYEPPRPEWPTIGEWLKIIASIIGGLLVGLLVLMVMRYL